MPWPQTTGQLTFSTEEAIRTKVLVSWYLEDASKFLASTKELIMRGSLRWAEREERDMVGVWWDLPDGLEGLFALSYSLPSLYFIIFLPSCESPVPFLLTSSFPPFLNLGGHQADSKQLNSTFAAPASYAPSPLYRPISSVYTPQNNVNAKCSTTLLSPAIPFNLER